MSDFTKQIPIIPISSKLGEGLPETLMFLAGLSQRFLEKKLTIEVSGPGKATVLEVKEEKGLGKTVDAILYDGVLNVGDEIVLGGKNGVIKTKVRALLEPKPLNEIKDPKEKFSSVKTVHAAAGVKIAAPNLDEALAGSPLLVATGQGEEKLVAEEIKSIVFEQDNLGPIMRADALGSLEALVKLAAGRGLKPKRADVGEVTRKDVLEAEVVAKTDRFKGVVFAFNTKIAPDAEEFANTVKVRIFKANVIYRLLEEYDQWVASERDIEKKDRLKSVSWPCQLQLLPNHVFRHSKPAIVGVRVLAGRLKTDAVLMNKNGERLGRVKAIQSNNQSVDSAKTGDEVAISIDDAVVGRNLAEKDELVVYLSPKMLDALEKVAGELSEDEKQLIQKIKKINEKRGDEEQ